MSYLRIRLHLKTDKPFSLPETVLLRIILHGVEKNWLRKMSSTGRHYSILELSRQCHPNIWLFLHFLLVLDSYLICKGVGGNWSGEIFKIQQFLEKVILKTVLFVHYNFSQKRVVQDERDAIFNLYFVNAISKQLWAASKPLVLTDKPKLFLPPTKNQISLWLPSLQYKIPLEFSERICVFHY